MGEEKKCSCGLKNPYKCEISFSLNATNAPLAESITHEYEYCTDEELKHKVAVEILRCMKNNGIIKHVSVLITEENRTINIM